MKITVLGSGSAYGTPMIFNDWSGANSGDPRNRRLRASVFLEDENKRLLVDAGPDLREQINREGIRDFDAVLLTHAHYDHIGGVPELPRASKILGHKIDIFASRETLEELKNCYAYLFTGMGEPDSGGLVWHVLHEGKENVAGLDLNVFFVPHHHMQSSGFRYKNFAYVTDWQALPEYARTQIDGADLLLAECNNGMEPMQNGHSSWPAIAERLKNLKINRVVLTHLSARVDYRTLQNQLPEDVQVAYDRMVLEI